MTNSLLSQVACPCLCGVLALGGGCSGGGSGDDSTPDAATSTGLPWFEQVARSRGVAMEVTSGFSDQYLLPEQVPGGAALFDMDNDGDLDLYVIQSGDVLGPIEGNPGNRLYANDGAGNFTDVTEGSGMAHRGFGMGVACGDYDNDGDVDVYLTNLGPNVLFRNDGDGRFTDVTAQAGVGHGGWGASAAFLDYDRDGDLDLFFTNYVRWTINVEQECFNAIGTRDYCGPTTYELPAADTLYRNDGNGTFTDASESAGINLAFGNGLGVGCADFNGDGWIDIFVANDQTPDHLWINRQDGTFIERALFLGCAVDQEGLAKAGMGVTIGDIDDDGDADLMVCNLARESDSLYVNQNGSFVDRTLHSGHSPISRNFTRFGMGWVDFNNDGLLDLYQANGRVMRQATSYGDDPYAEPNLLFRGVGSAQWEEVMPRGGTTDLIVGVSRTIAFGDIDADGGVDMVITNSMAEVTILRNIAPERGNWIALRVLDEHGRDAYGATVSVRLGDRVITRNVRAAYSYLASNDPKIHLGLGTSTGVTGVTVRWVDETVEAFGDLSGGGMVTLRRGEGKSAAN